MLLLIIPFYISINRQIHSVVYFSFSFLSRSLAHLYIFNFHFSDSFFYVSAIYKKKNICITYLTNIAEFSYIAGVNNHGRCEICDGRNNVKPIDIATNINGRKICERNTFQLRFV